MTTWKPRSATPGTKAREATLIASAPFVAFLNGNDAALSDVQKAGLTACIDKGCASCHSGINFGGNGYYPFGPVENPVPTSCRPTTRAALS